MLKKILLALLVTFVIIQFFRPAKNLATVPSPQALKTRYAIPSTIETSLRAACYDCHSNNTRYPWYAQVQPVSWYLDHHVNEGKQHFNFDAFLSYPAKKQDHKLEELVESLQEGWMPLDSYTLIHRDADLSTEQKQEIIAWANTIRKEIGYKGEKK